MDSFRSNASWILAFLAILYVVYRLLLPRPIPGVPYRSQSAKRLLGDLPDVFRWINDTGEIASFIPQKASKEVKSPIFQLWMRPFARPWVVITDFRETQDILTRRTKEFDRSSFFADIFSVLVPGSMVHMSTNDTWRSQRKLVGDTMTPSFLERVSAPSIYASGQALIGMWREKARLSAGHPFSVKEDLYRSGLDTIWAVAFGSQMGATQSQLDTLRSVEKSDLPGDVDVAATFPVKEEPEAFQSILTLAESVDIPISSAIPRLQYWLALRFMPSLVRATRHKDELITKQINIALEKFSKTDATEDDVECALEHVIHREMQLAEKENRVPDLQSMYIKDELFAFMIAGHDTSATTLLWGLKLLTDNGQVQSKLRKHLSSTFEDARRHGRTPSVKEISRAKLPYLDATLEEIYRLAGTSSAIFRRTTTDAVVLGHVIPKDTDVCMITFGPGFIEPAVPVDEQARSASSQQAKDKSGSWDPATIKEFEPERWLTSEGEFNPRAGPSLLFGGGMRGCFGRRLAELQIRILLTLILWTFTLEPIPGALSSYQSKDGITHAPRQCFLRLKEIS